MKGATLWRGRVNNKSSYSLGKLEGTASYAVMLCFIHIGISTEQHSHPGASPGPAFPAGAGVAVSSKWPW